MGYCVICAKSFTRTKGVKMYEDVCVPCEELLKTEAPNTPLYGGVGDINSEIHYQIEELEGRIPGLFKGPVCPLDVENGVGCSCTYEKGCQEINLTKEKK